MKSAKINIHVVEDNEWFNKMLVHTLELNPDFEVRSYMNGSDLLESLKLRPDIVTLDYRLPDFKGNELLSILKKDYPEIEVIVISEQEDIETAVDLLKMGAYDYLVKTKDIRDRLMNSIGHILENRSLKTQVAELRSAIRQQHGLKQTMIGESAAMTKVLELIEKALDIDITVSLFGETGTGKEVLAKAIHYNSSRASKPFVPVNLAALPAELIESELFGHEKGAFTGANNSRIGRFEEANGGTLFLDEIGEIDLVFQKKLLRVLQEREVVRLGSNKPISFDCRLIIATNKDLSDLVRKGEFREDLFYRLKGLPIELPPLRDRGDDIVLLSQFFLDDFCERNKLGKKRLDQSALDKLTSYAWPGNIRELKSIIELSVVLAGEELVEASHIHLGDSGDILPNLLTHGMTMRDYEIRIVQHLLQKYEGDTKKVAEELAIGQTTVYRLMKEAKAQS